ncbi:MAG TPA: alkaline phosphatase family protein [Candidatus Omnitrophota bacterium]|nr:alkaline phosphatase family protein [Candidatus Omnitrophota bacterium]MDD5270079.1 alkaline phosphatase family protein [Candidatus Omnitrophota bacterium]MDD5736824.1 alkaline phosphatase family protein [Candidatus Omnitrophota bacterium]HOX10344.1 alkaline phosphatase family protein [Candidatus Omnitrophota bacterium]HPN66175.1 alkaline phosphatase family protein [Candidatus Omnitrophota bacterium]
MTKIIKGDTFLLCAVTVFLWMSTAGCAVQPAEKSSNIILIAWDGAQHEHVKECLGRGELPNLKMLASEGGMEEITVQGQTETEPGFARILTGYKSETNRVLTNSNVGVIPKDYTVFERLENHFNSADFVTIALVAKGHRINSSTPDKPYYNAGQAADVFRNGLLDDKKVASEATVLLKKYRDRQFFMFLQFASPDSNGHSYGENSVEYNNALILCDKLTGEVISKLKALGIYGKTIIYVTADHGFDEGSRGHGFAPYVFIATNDPRGVRPGVQTEITPTILDRFGVDVEKISPPYDGKPLTK